MATKTSRSKYRFNPREARDRGNLAEIAGIIGVEPAHWVGRCYEIAGLLIRHNVVAGDLHYGHWNGPVVAESIFAGKPIVPHGWIMTGNPNYPIIDPTRFAFFGVDPYIYAGKDYPGYYDSGGQALRAATRGEPPAYSPSGRPSSLVITDPAVRAYVDALLGRPEGWTLDHDFWLSNLPIAAYGPYAREIVQAFIDAGQVGLLPLDTRHLVLGTMPSNRREE